MRLALTHAAEHVASAVGATAESLRELDADVAEGERNELGLRKCKPEDEVEQGDARVNFERTMDSTKEGSKTIGAGQAAISTAQDLSNRASERVQGAFYKICDRAQDDPEYHQVLSTLFDLTQKWVHRSLDAAGNVNQAMSLEILIDDPTPDKHLITGIRGLRALLERLACGRSLDGFFGAVRVCGVDIQQDEHVRGWCDRFIAHLRSSLDERGYVHSEEAKKERESLGQEWRELLDKDSETGRKWKEDIGALKTELHRFEMAVQHDHNLRRIRKAHRKLGDDLKGSLLIAGSAGLHATMEKAPWFWQDVFNVYLSRLIGMVKHIPIPRTEYKDAEVEFVLEDLDVSSFALLPGHAYIRNITDIDIQAPFAGSATTAVGTLTRVYLQELQLSLREVSFYYHDKTTTVGPAELKGMLEFTLPPQGIDVDIVVRTIPNSPEGLKQRAQRGGLLDIQRVEAKLSDDVQLVVTQSNHPILMSVFRLVILARFREALQTMLEQQLRAAFEGLDALAWDVGRRAEVCGDTGLGRGASLIAAFWSEIKHLQKGEGGLLSGWKATGTGVIKDDVGAGAQFSMGAKPQVLSGEKRGPKGTRSRRNLASR